jgi:protein TonB
MAEMAVVHSDFEGSQNVSVSDRFGFTLFLAVAVHVVLILGVVFVEDPAQPVSRTLEVTLSQFKSEQAPERADFIAQNNQLGSGESEVPLLPSVTETPIFQANESQPLAPQQLSQTQQQPERPPVESPPSPQRRNDRGLDQSSSPSQEVVTTVNETGKEVISNSRKREPTLAAPKPPGTATSLLDISLEIASQLAKIDLQKQNNARKPRVRRLYSASTKEAVDAAYLDSWRRKIERVGNLNYPQEARRRKLHGTLRLLVALLPDGSIKEVEVLKSSGHQVLDDAAKRIVHLAAPYAPFPPEIRQRTDVMEIIRTWRFEKNYRLL